jgi:hypothetical protein
MAKKFLFLLIIFIISCEKTPVGEYSDTMINIYQGTKETGKQITLKNIQDTIKMYYIENGAYPKDFEEVKSLMDSPIDSEIYVYNPETGEITLKK